MHYLVGFIDDDDESTAFVHYLVGFIDNDDKSTAFVHYSVGFIDNNNKSTAFVHYLVGFIDNDNKSTAFVHYLVGFVIIIPLRLRYDAWIIIYTSTGPIKLQPHAYKTANDKNGNRHCGLDNVMLKIGGADKTVTKKIVLNYL